MTTTPAEPGFVVVIPLFDDDGIAGVAEHPVIAWRTEGKQLVPITKHGDVEEEMTEDRYALRHPDDGYHFPDGEHCDNADALVASFKKRFVGESGTWLMSNHETTVFIVLVFGMVVLLLCAA
jgi:hypothetical protein